MRITVLRGGISDERPVSLISGQAVIDGLRSMGHEVFDGDISPENLSALDVPADVIFPVLHGRFGEDGQLQEILERRGLKFVGSGSAASRIGIDKVQTKRLWESKNLPTPPYRVLTRQTFDAERPGDVEFPCAVKALGSGSSIDVHVCKTRPAALTAVREVLEKHAEALVERFVAGTEVTVGIFEERPLSPIRIVPKREFFDYEAKYQDNGTEHRFNTGLPAEVVERMQSLALSAHQSVGCRDLSRVDVIVDASHHPWLLEINTLPGFTPKSLLPEAAAHAGVPFGPLVDRLARRAFERQ